MQHRRTSRRSDGTFWSTPQAPAPLDWLSSLPRGTGRSPSRAANHCRRQALFRGPQRAVPCPGCKSQGLRQKPNRSLVGLDPTPTGACQARRFCQRVAIARGRSRWSRSVQPPSLVPERLNLGSSERTSSTNRCRSSSIPLPATGGDDPPASRSCSGPMCRHPRG
jgi:hypothetical protein